VLIVNWDAANGDPEFGSHLALQWLEHRRPEILLWVRDGGILIIEGQAVLSVPSQRAYDGLVGPFELPVCGPEDPQNPARQGARIGDRCRKTKRAPTASGFDNVPDKMQIRGDQTQAALFPGAAIDLLTAHIRNTAWDRALYRGWFRRVLPWNRSLPWVSIVETADRDLGKNHSTMQVAKVGQGAIFATTMFLATTRQDELVLALLNCANRNTAHLPRPALIVDQLQKRWQAGLTFLAGIVAGYSSGLTPLVNHAAAAIDPGFRGFAEETVKSVIRVAFVLFGVALFLLLKFVGGRVVRTVKGFVGF